jgi:cytochrome c oxidase subunit 1
MFWFFGHPEVYIVALPFFGVVTEIFAVFSRRPVFGYKGMILATLTIAGYSVGVWAHHMFATGVVFLPFFSALSLLIAVPTGVKFFNWIGTMWRGSIRFRTPMLFSIGFLVVFLVGGISGVQSAMAPIDFNIHDTYFVVAHMHTIFMAVALALFGAIYYWFPKFTGRMMSERLGKWNFWLVFVGSIVTFTFQYQLAFNLISTVGSFIIAVGVLIFVWNFFRSLRHGAPAGDDPWDAQTLEWATSSPPPERNFTSLPPIRSEHPLWDKKLRELEHR